MEQMLEEITVQALAARLSTADAFVLLDVREPWELGQASIQDDRLVLAPLSTLGRGGIDALPAAARNPETEVLVICHHGSRSAQVAAWLSSKGWKRAFSVIGGLEEYALKVDASVGRY